MAVNSKYLISKGLSVNNFLHILLLFQNKTEDMSTELEETLEKEDWGRLFEMDLISEIKTKKKGDHPMRAYRLSKKGNQICKNMQILDFTVEDEKLLEALTAIYVSVDKPVGNPIKVKQLLAWFRAEGGFTRRDIYYGVKGFISKQVEEHGEKFIPSLENFIWKGSTVFSAKWTLADSRLQHYIENNKR